MLTAKSLPWEQCSGMVETLERAIAFGDLELAHALIPWVRPETREHYEGLLKNLVGPERDHEK